MSGGGSSQPNEAERALATEAQRGFERGDLDLCLSKLQALSISGVSSDPALHFDKAVAEFIKSGCTRVDEFKQALLNVAHLLNVNLENAAGVDDPQLVYLYATWCVVLYYQKRYHAASSIVNRLLTTVNPSSEAPSESEEAAGPAGIPFADIRLASNALLLSVDVFLATQEFNKLIEVVLPKLVALLALEERDRSAAGSSSPSAPVPLLRLKVHLQRAKVALHLRDFQMAARDLEALDAIVLSAPEAAADANGEPSAKSYEPALCFLRAQLEYQLGNSQKSLKLLTHAGILAKNKSKPGDTCAVVFYNNVGVLHAQMGKHHLASLYFRQALRENELAYAQVRPASSSAPTSASAAGNGSFFGGSTGATGEEGAEGSSSSGSGAPRYGNKPAGGAGAVAPTGPFTLAHYSIGRQHELLYNIGVELLFGGNALGAFDCLAEALALYPRNPLLWHRVAECCIAAHRESNDVDRQLARRTRVVCAAVGSGMHRKLVLSSSAAPDYVSALEAGGAGNVPMSSLEFASHCIRNALQLLTLDTTLPFTRHLSQIIAAHSGAPPGVDAGFLEGCETPRLADLLEQAVACPPLTLRGADLIALRNSVHVNGAYVSLQLKDHVMALHMAQQVLSPQLGGVVVSPALMYLARLYCAEALVLTDRLTDAIPYLRADAEVSDLSLLHRFGPPGPACRTVPEQRLLGSGAGGSGAAFGGISGTLPLMGLNEAERSASTPLYTWAPASVPRARAFAQYNLAVVVAIGGNFNTANECLASAFALFSNDSKSTPGSAADTAGAADALPAHFYALRLYLMLADGRKREALAYVREQFGHLSLNRLDASAQAALLPPSPSLVAAAQQAAQMLTGTPPAAGGAAAVSTSSAGIMKA